MVEKIICDYLTATVAPAYPEMPEEMPERLILVERTGGGITNRLRNATIAIQSYAPTLFEAAELNEEVLTAMEQIVWDTHIGRAQLNSNYNYTDPTTKRYRYQAVYDVVYFEE
ncbi:MAG: hypothetical protein K5707_04185 [Clostridia bacterium]|nr:hypothetical protein [Clostridia bacterium]